MFFQWYRFRKQSFLQSKCNKCRFCFEVLLKICLIELVITLPGLGGMNFRSTSNNGHTHVPMCRFRYLISGLIFLVMLCTIYLAF